MFDWTHLWTGYQPVILIFNDNSSCVGSGVILYENTHFRNVRVSWEVNLFPCLLHTSQIPSSKNENHLKTILWLRYLWQQPILQFDGGEVRRQCNGGPAAILLHYNTLARSLLLTIRSLSLIRLISWSLFRSKTSEAVFRPDPSIYQQSFHFHVHLVSSLQLF